MHGRHRLHPLVAGAAEALESAGVRWALLRGEHDLGNPRGDVDILVHSSRDLEAVGRALQPLGIVAVPQVGAGAHRLFVGHHRPTRRWVEFDVEWDLDFGPQHHFMLARRGAAVRRGQAVLARRRRAPDLPGMWVLHPDDAFWALLLHVIVDKAAVKPHHADCLVVLSDQASPSGPLAQVVAAACPPGWDARAHHLLRTQPRLGHADRTRAGAHPAVLHPPSRGLSERRLRTRHVRRRLTAAYHRLRGRTAVVEVPDAERRVRADVVIDLDPDSPVTPGTCSPTRWPRCGTRGAVTPPVGTSGPGRG